MILDSVLAKNEGAIDAWKRWAQSIEGENMILSSMDYLVLCMDFTKMVKNDLSYSSFIHDLCSLLANYHEYYKEIVEYLVEKYNVSTTSEIQNKGLNFLLGSLFEKYEIKSIFNPFSGMSSYALIDGIIEYTGYSSHFDRIQTIAKIRLDAHGKDPLHFTVVDDDPSNLSVDDIDSIVSLWDKRKSIGEDWNKINCMVSALAPEGHRNNSEDYSLSKTFHKLVYNYFADEEWLKYAFIVCPKEICLDKNFEETRQFIIENNFLELVVELPKEMYPESPDGYVLVMLSKERGVDRFHTHVTMVDARHLYVNHELDHETIMRYIDVFTMDEELDVVCNFMPYLMAVSKDDIAYAELNILPSKYSEIVNISNKIPDGYEVKRLSEILKPFDYSNHIQGPVRCITAKNLAKTPYSEIDYDALQPYPCSRENYSIHYLDRDLLLCITTLGDELKATHFRYDEHNEKLAVKSVSAYELIDDSLTYEYIVSELWKDYMRMQYIGLKPTSISYACDFFLTLQILVPVKGENFEATLRNSIADARDAFNKAQIQKLGLELEHIKDTRHNEYIRNIRMRKHAIAQVLNEICPALDMLQLYKDQKGGQINDTDIVSERSGMSVQEYFDFLRNSLYKMSDMVDRLADDYTEKEKGSLDLLKFLKEYTDNYACGTTCFKFAIDCDSNLDEYIKKLGSSLKVTISEESMSRVLKNIFVNAVRHGFTDESRRDYCIRIHVSRCNVEHGEEGVQISISNNGAPLSSEISSDEIYTWGVSSNGTGIGGYEVKGIIEANGGAVNFESNPKDKSGFYVKYIIKLPIDNE
jgi:signal transduction histidine kinase